eukprot:CAMPEP_0197579814 /NCGR_PEP_ID=MMETSP1326-20131121/3728_1 /TAXON_ID=1155430 /ORGANISM="Genus nov. species nov., Strain RCC2288" /LENGTH=561 /DNA_ID=CAMNT_0043143377 /DNA_START=179 /DNA_END=1864 /DNA_ORIENTATION=+
MGCGSSGPEAPVADVEPADTEGPPPAPAPVPGNDMGGGSSFSLSSLPSKTFTEKAPRRDLTTGGIASSILTDFQFGKVLGTGGFAVVKEAKHLRTKETYAVKIMNVAKGDGDEEEGMTLEEIAEEIRLTMSLSHEKIVKIYDFYQTKTHVYVIMELLRGGELLDAVMELGSYNEVDAATIMRQLFKGLESIHSKSISHRDLKLENLILATKNDLETLRIADFGLAKKMKTARSKLSAQCGSPAYVAPEVITGQQYTPAVDMWAAGVIMYALLCGELPFYDDDEQEMFRKIARAKMHPLPAEVSREARDLLSKLLCVDKVQRLTAAEALEHKWVRAGRKSGVGLASGASLKNLKNGSHSRMSRFAEKRMGSEMELRMLKAGDLLIKQGERAKHVFLIKEGSCEVVVDVDGQEMMVAERHAGEFVGEMGVKVKTNGSVNNNSDHKDDPPPPPPTKKEAAKKEARVSTTAEIERGMLGVHTLMRVKNTWLGGRRGANVRATTDMKVLVLSSIQMQWILEHDYGVDGEMTDTKQSRQAQLEKTKSMVPNRPRGSQVDADDSGEDP